MTHGNSFLQTTRTSEPIADEGIGLPPYHFRCRTTTVAYSEPSTYHEKVLQMAYDDEVSTTEAVRLVDFAKNAPRLTELDSKLGDGDHGTTMAKVMKAVAEIASSRTGGDMKGMLTDVGAAEGRYILL